MARLPDRKSFSGCQIPRDDPLRFHYWPIIGRFYRGRIDGCVALLGTGKRVLDIGYGSGTSFLELSGRFEEIHGLDVHDYGPAIAAVFAREGLRVALERGSILDPPYPDGHFDAILAMSVFEHLMPCDQPVLMSHVHRLLRPGGVLVVGVPGFNPLMILGFRLLGFDIRKHHFSSPRDVLDAVSRIFSVERIVRHPPLLPDPFLTYVWLRARRA